MAWEYVPDFPHVDINALILSDGGIAHIQGVKSASFEAYPNEKDLHEFHNALGVEGPTRANFGATVAFWKSQWDHGSRPVRKEEIICFSTFEVIYGTQLQEAWMVRSFP